MLWRKNRQTSSPLHPISKASTTPFFLNVSPLHTLYGESYGAIEGGTPALFLHGGPGSGCHHGQKALFDPKTWRVIFFDQRGSGKSTPKTSIEENTTPLLIEDIEAIREHWAIESWVVVGGSWGATLALAYARAYPHRVRGMVLRGTFLARPEDTQWAFYDAPQLFRPDLWEQLCALTHSQTPIEKLMDDLSHDDPAIHQYAARLWGWCEQSLALLNPQTTTLPSINPQEPLTTPVPNTPYIESHYIRHDFFLKETPLLANTDPLRHMPIIMLCGRYDLLCPPRCSYALKNAIGDNCHVRLIEKAGHSTSDKPLQDALAHAITEASQWPVP
ncbi:MAG: alpha/beta fold hydrolase [Alphaproteobacteria bacterium GM7ARS4]|nr:alpha/beta fold hydrolase [Alphaproteobacteria bacterium GM7ARS4]